MPRTTIYRRSWTNPAGLSLRLELLPADVTAFAGTVEEMNPGSVDMGSLSQECDLGDYPIGLREADTLEVTFDLTKCQSDLRDYLDNPEGPAFSTTGYDVHFGNASDVRYWYFGHYGRTTTLNLLTLWAEFTPSTWTPVFVGVQRPTPRPEGNVTRGRITKTITFVDAYKYAIEEIQEVIHPVFNSDDWDYPDRSYSRPGVVALSGGFGAIQAVFANPAQSWNGGAGFVENIDGVIQSDPASDVSARSANYRRFEWIVKHLANIVDVFVKMHRRLYTGTAGQITPGTTITFYEQDFATPSRTRGSAVSATSLQIAHSGPTGFGQFATDSAEYTFAKASSIWDFYKELSESLLHKVRPSWLGTPGSSSLFLVIVESKPFDSFTTHSTTYDHGEAESITWEESAGTLVQANGTVPSAFQDDVIEHKLRRGGAYADDEVTLRFPLHNLASVPEGWTVNLQIGRYALTDSGLFYIETLSGFTFPAMVHGSITVDWGGPVGTKDYNPTEEAFASAYWGMVGDEDDPTGVTLEQGYIVVSQQVNSLPAHVLQALLDQYGSRNQAEYEITLPISSDLQPKYVGDVYSVERPDSTLTYLSTFAVLMGARYDWVAGTVSLRFVTLNPDSIP